jgi:histone-lysine N-methyltransferase SETD3
MSRQNKIPILHRQGVSVLALIPLWDMANHSSGKIMTDFDTGTQSCVCYSMTDLAPGEEFKIFYGPRGNSEFLLNQGFAIRDNPHDNIKMWIGVKNITDDALRKAIFDKLQIATFGQFVVSSNEGFPFSSELVTFVRLFTASEEELKLWQNETNDKVIEWISRKTWNKEDERTLEFLEKRCQLLLLPYKTTIDVSYGWMDGWTE